MVRLPNTDSRLAACPGRSRWSRRHFRAAFFRNLLEEIVLDRFSTHEAMINDFLLSWFDRSRGKR
jgi:hypothetical protein